MLFNSTYSENLKRREVQVEIGYVSIDDYESGLVEEIQTIVKRAGIKKDKVKFYKESVEVDEFRREDRLILYYLRPETDAEYNNRIEVLKLKDLGEFVNMLGQFNSAVAQKLDLEHLYNQFKHKRQFADWQKEQIKLFFNTESTEELIKKAYLKGRAEVKQELLDLRKKLKSI